MISTAEKLSRLETKIEKRKAAIAEETKKLNADLAEYDKLCLLALADKFKLKGKDLFSAIEREHEQLEKLKENAPVSDAETLGQTSFFESKYNPYED